MFYHCTKFQIDLPGSVDPGVGGGIVAASPRSKMALLRHRRLVKDFPYLTHRLFDPQLYFFNLPATAKHVPNLATYPWFGVPNPPYDSKQHKKVREWMETNDAALRTGWSNKGVDVAQTVATAIDFQVAFGSEAILLPAPLTIQLANQYEAELQYMDAGIAYCKTKGYHLPVYATVALSDSILRGVSPIEHGLLKTISDQIAARREISGAYLVVEQSADSGHCYSCEEGCLAILLLIDDLVRGAKKEVIVNYVGTFGLLCIAAGASIWASGHYRSQRRFKLADEEDERGSAYPRYYSARLAGDIGLDSNVELAYASGLREWLFVPSTNASHLLITALKSGKKVEDVLSWRYTQGNIVDSAKHYHEICVMFDAFLSELNQAERVRAVKHWLQTAASLASKLSRLTGFQRGSHTDVSHQQVWLNAFNKWRRHSGI